MTDTNVLSLLSLNDTFIYGKMFYCKSSVFKHKERDGTCFIFTFQQQQQQQTPVLLRVN